MTLYWVQSLSVFAIVLMLLSRLIFSQPRATATDWCIGVTLGLVIALCWHAILPMLAIGLVVARLWDWKGRDLAAKYWPWG